MSLCSVHFWSVLLCECTFRVECLLGAVNFLVIIFCLYVDLDGGIAREALIWIVEFAC